MSILRAKALGLWIQARCRGAFSAVSNAETLLGPQHVTSVTQWVVGYNLWHASLVAYDTSGSGQARRHSYGRHLRHRAPSSHEKRDKGTSIERVPMLTSRLPQNVTGVTQSRGGVAYVRGRTEVESACDHHSGSRAGAIAAVRSPVPH